MLPIPGYEIGINAQDPEIATTTQNYNKV